MVFEQIESATDLTSDRHIHTICRVGIRFIISKYFTVIFFLYQFNKINEFLSIRIVFIRLYPQLNFSSHSILTPCIHLHDKVYTKHEKSSKPKQIFFK